jgi:hypothetical protein
MAITTAIVGGVAALGSAGAGIYSASQAGKGGGGGAMFPTNMNPAHYDLANLFGSQKASNKLASRAANGHPSIFGADFKTNLQNYMNSPTSFGPGGPGILSSIIGDPQQYLQNYNKSLGYLDQAVNTASQFNANGNPTDAQPIYNEALRQYMKYALPGAAETSGLGTSSSGFIANAGNAGENLFSQAAMANVDLQEAAKARQMQAAPLLQGLVGARQALPLNLADQLTGLFNFEARKPLDVFSTLSTLGSQGPYAAPAYSPFNNGSANTAAILQGLGGLAGSPAFSNAANSFSNYINSPSNAGGGYTANSNTNFFNS